MCARRTDPGIQLDLPRGLRTRQRRLQQAAPIVLAAVLLLAACSPPGPASRTAGVPTPGPGGKAAPTPAFEGMLGINVSWAEPVLPPQASFSITIELDDPAAAYADWILGDAGGEIERGRLAGGSSTTVDLPVNWPGRPPRQSTGLFYVYAAGDNGSTFAQAVTVQFDNTSIDSSPEPTPSCGYASFRVITAPDLLVESPTVSFSVRIANEGILACGDLDWQLVVPSPQAEALWCSPDHGVLEGAPGYDESTVKGLACRLNWEEVPPGPAVGYFLVLYSYPRVNGRDSIHLLRVRATGP